MAVTQSRQGPGRFQWNAGGWFGAQVGSTIWLLGAALTVLPTHVAAAVVAFLCFLLPNIIGLLLYLRRNRIAPYPALQGLILLVGIVSIILVLYLNHIGLVDQIDPRLGHGQWGFYLLPVLFGGLMVLFHFLERSAVKRRHKMSD
jgi:hypothetical protein